MIYGYPRVSTPQQKIERQITNIQKAYPAAKLYIEKYTGTTLERPRWRKLMRVVKEGDTIVFDSVSRMSRNADDGEREYMELFEKGVNLVFLKEPHISTDTYRQALQSGIASVGNDIADIYINATNEVLKLLARRQIRLAFEQAQKEVDDLHERTSEGMRAAKARDPNKVFGHKKDVPFIPKKKQPAKDLIEKYSKDFLGSLDDIAVMKLLKQDDLVKSKNTYYKYKAELRDEWKKAKVREQARDV